MTTARSPLSQLKAQAYKIARLLKAAERGDPIDDQDAAKLRRARSKDVIKFAVIMDDKILSIEMPWDYICETSEVGIAEWILNQMRLERKLNS